MTQLPSIDNDESHHGPYQSAEQALEALHHAPFGIDDTYAQIEVAVAEALRSAGLRDTMTPFEQDALTWLARQLVAAERQEIAQNFAGWIRRAAEPC